MERYRAWILMTRIALGFSLVFVGLIALVALLLAIGGRCS